MLSVEVILTKCSLIFGVGFPKYYYSFLFLVLLWVMYFLASHTDVQEKLRKELKKAGDPEIMPESLLKMKLVSKPSLNIA